MIPSQHHKTLGTMPWERFVTTYMDDYKPFSERHPQVNQTKPRTEAKTAPALISPPQTDCDAWPIFHHYFYKTTNSIYGSGVCLQPPSRSVFPAVLPPYGTRAPSVSEAFGVVGSILTGARTQEMGGARETGPLLGEQEKGQLGCVFGGEANVLEQQEAEDEPQQKIDVLFEEGEIVLSPCVGPACCDNFLRSVCREARLQHLLHLPVISGPIITVIDAEIWDNNYPRGLRPAIELKNSIFLQPASRRCSCCAWETERPDRGCFNMQTFPRGSVASLAHVQPTVYCREPSKKPWLTEYQENYTAAWVQPKIQKSDFHHHPPHHQQILHPSL